MEHPPSAISSPMYETQWSHRTPAMSPPDPTHLGSIRFFGRESVRGGDSGQLVNRVLSRQARMPAPMIGAMRTSSGQNRTPRELMRRGTLGPTLGIAEEGAAPRGKGAVDMRGAWCSHRRDSRTEAIDTTARAPRSASSFHHGAGSRYLHTLVAGVRRGCLNAPWRNW